MVCVWEGSRGMEGGFSHRSVNATLAFVCAGLIVRGVHRISLDSASTAGAARRGGVADLYWRPLSTYSLLEGVTPAAWISQYKASRPPPPSFLWPTQS